MALVPTWGALLVNVVLAQSAPPDRPITLDSAALACMRAATAPLTARAQATLPNAVARFRAGLKPNYYFSVSVRLYDQTGREEQVFVSVDSLHGDTLVGRLASDIAFVAGFQRGMSVHVLPAAALDWTIVNPDGTEEGNLIGKWVDAIQDSLTRNPGVHLCSLLPPNKG